MRCGSKVELWTGTLTLARGRGRTLQSPRHGEESSRVGTLHAWAARYLPILRTGTGGSGEICRDIMYRGTIGASGYRVLLAGQETEHDAYGLGQA